MGMGTYAWFVNNNRVTAETADVTATTADYLLISADDVAFGTSMVLDTTAATLTPVSITDDTLKSANPTFFKVKDNDQAAWVDNEGITKANIFTNAATTDYYHDTVYLKSSAANTTVRAKLNLTLPTEKVSHAEEAMYIAFVPVSGSTYGAPVIYQLAGTNLANTLAGANTNIGDSNTGNYTTSGVKTIQTDGTLTTNDKAALTIANTNGTIEDLTFGSLAEANTSYQYEVYVWMEGTDPQCYNTVANSVGVKNANVKVSFEFYTGEYPA